MLAPNKNRASGETLILDKAIPEQSFYCGSFAASHQGANDILILASYADE